MNHLKVVFDMRYNDKLDDMPMNIFIGVYTGEDRDIQFVPGIDRECACKKLISSYMSIIGEKNIRARVSCDNGLLNHSIRLKIAYMAQEYYKMGHKDYVREILCSLGHPKVEDNIMQARIASIIASESFALDRERSMRKSKSSGNNMTKEDFTRERVVLMRHYKMYIDIRTYSAAEYAYLVKGFCEEAEQLERQKSLMRIKAK